MKRLSTLLVVILFNLALIFLFLEIGYRSWLYFASESSSDFEQKITEEKEVSEKRKITGNVTLGSLIQKSRDSGRVYELMPNIEATYLGQPFETSSYGMRDKHYSIAKGEGVVRIVGIGDSVMFGWGVKAEDTYLSLIEETLAKDSLKSSFEVLNFGVPGYNTAMEVSTYESLARKFAPDILVVHFVDNDLEVPLFMESPPELTSMKKSFIIECIRDLNRALRNRPKANQDLIGAEFSGVESVKKYKVLDRYRYMVGNSGFKAAMTKLAKMTCEDKVKVLILTGKLRGRVGEMLSSIASQLGFEIVEAYPVVNRYFAENGLDNSPASRKKLLWLSNSDPHPSVLGHKLYAKTLLPKVKEILAGRDEEVELHCGAK